MNNLNMHSLKQLLTDKQPLETREVLKVAARAESRLGELKGLVKTIPNEGILLNTLLLQEAKASAEIENIVTTNDELFQSRIDNGINGPTKEVRAHEDALIKGFEIVREQKILKLGDITRLQAILIENDAGIRTLPGTVLKNSAGDVVYTPPPPDQVPDLMSELMEFINDSDTSDLNPLVKMAIIHHQFESIHPFYDGNGRMGRIINLLYLVLAGRLDLPVLCMSRYIMTNKAQYYELLRTVREEGTWEAWLLYMLRCISETAKTTIACVNAINELLQRYKHSIRKKHPRHYSHDLINNLFKHPYTTIAFLKKDLNCVYATARKKLELLAKDGYVEKISRGRTSYYVNEALVDCLMNIHAPEHLLLGTFIGNGTRRWDMKSKIFISHHHSDASALGQLKDRLAPVGFDCFIAHEDIKPGEHDLARIEEEIRACHGFVYVGSEEANASEFCQQEVGMAKALDKKIITAMTKNSPPTGFIARIQAIKYKKIDSDFCDTVFKELRKTFPLPKKIQKALENLDLKFFSRNPEANSRICLYDKNWNDYSFRTAFEIYIDQERIGTVKIGYSSQTTSDITHDKLPRRFEYLELPFFSRVRIDDYKQNILNDSQVESLKVLLNDTSCLSKEDHAIVSEEPVYKKSLFM